MYNNCKSLATVKYNIGKEIKLFRRAGKKPLVHAAGLFLRTDHLECYVFPFSVSEFFFIQEKRPFSCDLIYQNGCLEHSYDRNAFT